MFDLMLTQLDDECYDGKKPKINVLKRQQTYFNLSYTLGDIQVQFNDILSQGDKFTNNFKYFVNFDNFLSLF